MTTQVMKKLIGVGGATFEVISDDGDCKIVLDGAVLSPEAVGLVSAEPAPADVELTEVAAAVLSTEDTYTDAAVKAAIDGVVDDVNAELATLESALNTLTAALVAAGVLTSD